MRWKPPSSDGCRFPVVQTTATNDSPAARYPLAYAVLRLPMEGQKRRKVLASIAAFHDEGHQPALREIIKRAGLTRGIKEADRLLKRLEADGYLRIEWAPRSGKGSGQGQRNRYEVVLPEA